MELTLKHIFAKNMLPYLRDILSLLNLLVEQAGGKRYAEDVILYIIDRGEIGKNKEPFVDLIKNGFSSKVGDKIMTIAELFREEGLQQGLSIAEQEIKQERINIVKRLLLEKMEHAFISRITGLSIVEIQAVEKELI